MRLIDADALQTALVDEYSGIAGHKMRGPQKGGTND